MSAADTNPRAPMENNGEEEEILFLPSTPPGPDKNSKLGNRIEFEKVVPQSGQSPVDEIKDKGHSPTGGMESVGTLTEEEGRRKGQDDGNRSLAGAVGCFHEKLPVEIWDTIFGYLKDSPETLTNCTQACSEWSEILKTDKSSFMLPWVIPILAGDLRIADILNWRLVSKTWKGNIDTFLQNPCKSPTLPPCYESSHFAKKIEKGLATYFHDNDSLGTSFENPTDFTKFMYDMRNQTGNPFPTRNVSFRSLHESTLHHEEAMSMCPAELLEEIQSEDEEGYNEIPSSAELEEEQEAGNEMDNVQYDTDDEEYDLDENDYHHVIEENIQRHHKYLHRMLRRFGDHIWHFQFELFDRMATCAGYLNEVLKHLPNLRSLALEMGLHQLRDLRRLDYHYYQSFSELPNVPGLVKLRFDSHGNYILTDRLIQKYGNQLEILEYDYSTSGLNWHELHGSSYSMSNLRCLTIQMRKQAPVGTSSFACYLNSFTIPNLQRLSLNIYGNYVCSEKEVWNVIKVVSKFSPTLKQLTFYDKELGCRFSDGLLPMLGFCKVLNFNSNKQAVEFERIQELDFPHLETFNFTSNLLSSSILPRIWKKFLKLRIISISDSLARKWTWRKLPDQSLVKQEAWESVKFLWTQVPTLETILYSSGNEFEFTWTRTSGDEQPADTSKASLHFVQSPDSLGAGGH